MEENGENAEVQQEGDSTVSEENQVDEKSVQDKTADSEYIISDSNSRYLSSDAEILRSMLDLKGASCVICSNGKQVVEAFEESEPDQYDAVLMDVQMPVMNGYEASRRIRTSRRPFGKTIPIIALTANAFAEDIVRSSEAGMDAHITKPIDENKLKECMLRLLASR